MKLFLAGWCLGLTITIVIHGIVIGKHEHMMYEQEQKITSNRCAVNTALYELEKHLKELK